MDALQEDNILATFDKLVSEGSIIFGPHETIKQDCAGYPLEFRICPSLTKKPHVVGATLDASFDKSEKWGPGSDMYCTDSRLILAKLNHGTHDLALNLYSVDRPQFMALTTDSYRRQYEPLDTADFAAALEMLRLKDVYVIYNCGEKAGCSRAHKHLQGLRGPPEAWDVFVSQDEEERGKVPFRFFSHRFVDGFGAVDELVGVYEGLLKSAREVLGKGESEACPHNVVLWKDGIVVIPRRAAAVGKASANAAGMMGSNWVPDQQSVDEWTRLGCRHVLSELGVPNAQT
ncbi:hypothetical protein BDV95DRAFT_563804 [Massariosphaeria phaeospora]|uniref:Uncharacterized protein n=1 Tax=Massariosphaeria phaeospora TaxID=100035 RepID=A0A7C8IAX1_9PLEO|nr:hypothetical protein BDV95DRAFT_563804 [Massariosphaeria phaeospora]